jgi:hypothetical protein
METFGLEKTKIIRKGTSRTNKLLLSLGIFSLCGFLVFSVIIFKRGFSFSKSNLQTKIVDEKNSASEAAAEKAPKKTEAEIYAEKMPKPENSTDESKTTQPISSQEVDEIINQPSSAPASSGTSAPKVEPLTPDQLKALLNK